VGLLVELPRLKAAGASVFGMAAICNARWRLTLHWPEPVQQALLQDSTKPWRVKARAERERDFKPLLPRFQATA
jgi:hypothetical protein